MVDLPSADVAGYYEKNLVWFQRFGGSGDAAAIHRQIWAPGVRDAKDAFLYLNRLVVGEIHLHNPDCAPHVVDLGCGMGGTSTWIAQHTPARVTGIANTSGQIRVAQARARQLGLTERCQFLQADFLSLPDLEPAQAAVAIESFAHARDPVRFFECAARLLVPGGRLVICDDFLARGGVERDERFARRIGTFKRGWRLASLVSAGEADQIAARSGFKLVGRRDLTEYIRLSPPLVLWVMRALAALPLSHPVLENWRGGAALQECIRGGITRYAALTWEKG